jgi:hypothetical protein
MPDPLLPTAIPRSLAGAIAGQPANSFRHRVINAGLIECDERGFVILSSLERHLGRTISRADYLAADLSLEPSRRYQHNLRRARA